jgi:O-antigen/teichoic acid export membrane protein
LIAGQIIGLTVGLFTAIFLLSPPSPNIFLKPTSLQLNYLKKHRNFWRFSLPAGLLNIAAGRFPLFLIGAKYGLFAAGLYALTERVLTAPVSLLAASILEVFKRQSVHEFQTFGNCKAAYRNAFKALVLLGCCPALIIFAFAPDMLFLDPVSLTQVLWNYTMSYSALYVVYLFLSHRFAANVPVTA